jgi:hypothetical protein
MANDPTPSKAQQHRDQPRQADPRLAEDRIPEAEEAQDQEEGPQQMTEEDRIRLEYFESEAQRRSVEREFDEIAREWSGSVGLTQSELEQLLMRSGK